MKRKNRFKSSVSSVLATALVMGTLTAGIGSQVSAAPVQMYTGNTYFTDEDNWGGGDPKSTADGDVDFGGNRIKNGDSIYPIEYKIENVDQLPTVSAQLLVRAYDVDEYKDVVNYKSTDNGEWDRVYMSSNPADITLGDPYTNWPTTGKWTSATDKFKKEFKQENYIGALSGQNEIWNTTVFSLSPSDFNKIAKGNLYVGTSIHHYYLAPVSTFNSGWVTEIDWAQLVVDGGVRENGEINDAGLKVENGKITLDTTFLPNKSGNFVMEANVIQKVEDPNGNVQEINLDVETKNFTGATKDNEESWKPVLSNSAIDPNKEYIVNIMLFDARTDGTAGKAEHVLSFSTYNMKAADIEKRVLKDTELPFSLEDFQTKFFKNSGVSGAQDQPNGDNLQTVTIHTLPEGDDGKLFFNGEELTAPDVSGTGFVIKATDLSKLTFKPASTMDYDAEFEWSGYGQGKATGNHANVVLKMNYEPMVENFVKKANKGDTVSFTANDFSDNAFQDSNDGDNLTKVLIATLPPASQGKLVLDNGASTTDVEEGQSIPVADLGSLKFVPESGVSGAVEFYWNGFDGYQYAVEDKKVTIAINSTPVVADIAKTGLMGDIISFGNVDSDNFTASYTDEDLDPLHSIQVELPADFASKGQLFYYPGGSVTEAVYVMPGVTTSIPAAALNSLKFSPDEGLANGSTVTFDWYGFDGKQYSDDPAQVKIAYNGIPTADALVVNTQEGTPSTTIVLAGTDVGASVSGVVYQIESGPLKGTISPADPTNPQGGEWIYTPNSGATGVDKFTYTVTDAEGQTSAPAVVTVNVHKALDGWVGDKERGDSTILPAVPGYPLTLSAVSSLITDQVTANVNGASVDLIWVNQATSAEDGYKLWKKTNTVLQEATSPGVYDVTFTARDINGSTLPSEPADRLSDNSFEVLELGFTLTADPEQILGDGKSTSELTAVLKDAGGNPIANVEVTFDAPTGTFPNGNKVVTDENGLATVTYQSAAITGTTPQSIPVTATVLDLDKGLSASASIQMTFLPAQVKGIITEGGTNKPVAGASVRVTLDLNGDKVIEPGVDFDETVITDANGAYAIPVPKGNAVYDLTITQTVNIGGVETPVSYSQKAPVGETTGNGDETYVSEKTISGLVAFKQPNGQPALLSSELLSKTNVYLKDANGDYLMENGSPKAFDLSSQGVFNASGLAVGDYTLEVRYEIEPGKEITISKGTVNVKEDGELNITQQLVDPYGTVTDKVTGSVIEGAKVTLYYADTKSPVDLPELVGFAPNDNASPDQLTDANGFYAYMVYPETDYYVVVSKAGYYTYTSPILSVEWDIVKHDVALDPVVASVGSPVNPEVSLAVSTDQNVVQEGTQSTITVDYKNISTAMLYSGTITVQLPEGVEVVDANGGTVNGNTISWNVTNLAGGQSGSYKIKVKWSQLDSAEKEFSISGEFGINGSSASGAKANSTAKIKVFSDRFGNLSHQRYIIGMPDGEFKLGNSLTRAELAAIVARLTENETIDYALPFSDIRKGHWATNYIRIAVKHGYFGGFSDGTFRPDQAITRGELAAVMARFLDLNPGKPVSNHFSDTKGNWAENAIEALYLGNYLTGYTDGTFRPNQKIRRDEAVTMINRMLYRGPLQGLDPVFPDVPTTHWAFGEVQEATVSHEAVRNSDGSETFVKRIEDDVQ
jgi:Bacterial Ig-like domain (group 1)./S-layer homology domain.